MTKEQKIEAYAMRLDGKTYREIGEKFGVTRQRIEQILREGAKCKKSENCIYEGLAEYIKKKTVRSGT